jgi:hypothetical protein
VLIIIILAFCIGITSFLSYQNYLLRKNLNQQVLAYENLLSEKLHLEKKYSLLLSEWSMVKPDKVDSLRKVIKMRDQELTRLSNLIGQLNEAAEKSKPK